MAAAAHLRVLPSTYSDALGISQIARDDYACRPNGDRAFPYRRHQPKNWLGVWGVRSDVVDPRVEYERGGTDS